MISSVLGMINESLKCFECPTNLDFLASKWTQVTALDLPRALQDFWGYEIALRTCRSTSSPLTFMSSLSPSAFAAIHAVNYSRGTLTTCEEALSAHMYVFYTVAAVAFLLYDILITQDQEVSIFSVD